ncbi:phosphotriesterase family protein [Paraburkholderia megapolitana]|uniref:phosphotriesterase family protein n=1 Tax=Paraburkholderia megapolitana TaxID=420953 RepID=UPI0038BB9720
MEDNAKTIMTVRGPISPEDAGLTLIHEHLVFDGSCFCFSGGEPGAPSFAGESVTMERLGALRRNVMCMADNGKVVDIDFLVEAALAFKERGGGTIVDVTLDEIGRNVVDLRTISEKSGLNIVAGMGHYVHYSHPKSLEEESLESIADRMLREVVEGVGDTGIRPGILGELGTSSTLHPNEEKVLRASARVSAQTGISMTLHMDPGGYIAPHVLDILEAEGADPRRVVFGHLDLSINRDDTASDDPIWYIREVAKRGAYVALDTFGEENWYASGLVSGQKALMLPSDDQRMRAVLRLLEEGFVNQTLISQDVCVKTSHVRYGGFGYGYILEYIAPQLRAYGVNDFEIDRMMSVNTRNVLAF